MESAITLTAVCLLAMAVGAVTWLLEPNAWPTRPKTKGGRR